MVRQPVLSITFLKDKRKVYLVRMGLNIIPGEEDAYMKNIVMTTEYSGDGTRYTVTRI